MANKLLKSVTFPDLADKYIIGDTTLAVAGAGADSKTVGDALSTKAEIDGYYSDMTVGDAEQLVSTVFTEDSVPYNFRTSGGAIDIGDREYDTLVGGTVAWNQQAPNLETNNGYVFSRCTGTISDGVATLTANADGVSASRITIYNSTASKVSEPIANHKYLLSCYVKPSVALNYVNISFGNGVSVSAYAQNIGAWNFIAGMKTYSTPSGQYAQVDAYGSLSVGDTVQVKNLMVHDLTQMFGSTIADYIYSLEQGTAGAGVAFFKKLFPKPYYAYNAGTLMSVKALSHDMVGFNAWDEEWELGSINSSGNNETSTTRIRSKNYIPILPNTAYYYKSATSTLGIRYYDANKEFLGSSYNRTAYNEVRTSPANAYYVRFSVVDQTTYKNDICINLHWDGERDGEYEPYVKRSYPLDSNLELRGIPKLSANNDLYYDGDVYEADGTVTRRYGIVDLGTLTWVSLTSVSDWRCFYTNSLITDNAKAKGTNNFICSKYPRAQIYGSDADKVVDGNVNNGYIYVRDTAYNSYTTSQFKDAMSGVYLVYELATYTEETAEPYNEIQWVDDFGTEEYVDTRDVAVPVGHNTRYVPNLRAKLETAPDSPDADGDYVMRHSNGVNSYIPLASNATIQNIIARLEALENA